MRFHIFVSTAVLLNLVAALPSFNSEAGRRLLARVDDSLHCQDGVQIPRLFKLPPQPADKYVSKKIPGESLIVWWERLLMISAQMRNILTRPLAARISVDHAQD